MPSQTISSVALAVAWSSSVRTTDPSASTTTALTMAAPESVKSTVASSWTPSPFGVRYTSAGPSELIDTGLATSISPGAPVHVTYLSSAETEQVPRGSTPGSAGGPGGEEGVSRGR